MLLGSLCNNPFSFLFPCSCFLLKLMPLVLLVNVFAGWFLIVAVDWLFWSLNLVKNVVLEFDLVKNVGFFYVLL